MKCKLLRGSTNTYENLLRSFDPGFTLLLMGKGHEGFLDAEWKSKLLRQFGRKPKWGWVSLPAE